MKEFVGKAIEVAEKAVETASEIKEATKAQDVSAVSKFENASMQFKEGLSDEALRARVEAAAHSANTFFGIPDIDLVEGDAIGVYRGCDIFLDKDVFEYSLDQFKDMKCLSFEDMTKVWAHECGHRILRMDFPSGWAQELGADFFSGVRSEMLGLPTSNFEKLLASTTGSATHPVGSLRVQAVQFGRDVVRGFQEKGITPTIENCKEAFANSPFSKITYENQGSPKFKEIVKDISSEKAELSRNRNINNTNSDFNRVEDGELPKESSAEKETGVNESQMNEVKKTGGSYGELKKEGWGWNSEPPKEIHHMPSNESSYLEVNDGPAIVMDYQDHRQTASCGRSREAQEYRAKQKELIDQGKFREAMQMDIDDIHEKFGTKYDKEINQMLEYYKELETKKKV